MAENTTDRYNRVMVENNQNTSEPSSQTGETRSSAINWLPWVAAALILGIVAFFAIRVLFFSPENQEVATTNPPQEAEVDNQQSSGNQTGCFPLPNTSADVTDKFSGYAGYQAEGWVVPTCSVQGGSEFTIETAIVSWCQTQNECTWTVVEAGQKIPHEGEINFYRNFNAHEGELQYINPDATWTKIQ